MNNSERIAAVAPAVYAFAAAMGLHHEDPETIAGDFICDVLHWVAAEAGKREAALLAARCGVAHYVTESNIDCDDEDADEIGPDAFVTVIAECNGETWRSETAKGESIVGLSEDDRRIAELETDRDEYMLIAPDGSETPNPEGWALDNPDDAEELDSLYDKQRGEG